MAYIEDEGDLTRHVADEEEVPEEDAQLTFAGNSSTILAEVARHRAMQLAAARAAAETLANGDSGGGDKPAETAAQWALPLSSPLPSAQSQMIRNRSVSVFQARTPKAA
jgi:hypothetical protein